MLEDGRPFVQYTALGMLKGVLCQAGSGWSMQERFVQNAVKLRAKCNSFFVKKATVYVCVCVYLSIYVCMYVTFQRPPTISGPTLMTHQMQVGPISFKSYLLLLA